MTADKNGWHPMFQIKDDFYRTMEALLKLMEKL
jgi:hypothetical protein